MSVYEKFVTRWLMCLILKNGELRTLSNLHGTSSTRGFSSVHVLGDNREPT